MDFVDLPDDPAPGELEWFAVDFGGVLGSELGGSDQRVNRLGNRWRVELPLPAMRAADARRWTSKLNRGLRKGVRWRIIQPDLPVGIPGMPLVAGAGQAGETLTADGFTPGYFCRYGQKFAILTGGIRYVHEVSEPAVVDASGEVTLEIEPPLRVEPADNAVLEFADPFIEGFLEAPAGGRFSVDRIMRGVTIAIRERR